MDWNESTERSASFLFFLVILILTNVYVVASTTAVQVQTYTVEETDIVIQPVLTFFSRETDNTAVRH